MENKYYTPEIEEFHVGFDYQIFEDWDCFEEKTWHNQVYGKNGSDIENMGYVGGPDMNRFRVKYLDREDIESLGFVKGDGMWWNHPDGYQLGYGDVIQNHGAWITKGAIENQLDYWFKGTIKNKSELKRILKQIGA